MNRPKLFRALRIAWSVAWGVLAVVLIVLWVRSYWWVDYINIPMGGNRSLVVQLIAGLIAPGASGDSQFQMITGELKSEHIEMVRSAYMFGFGIASSPSAVLIVVPFWLVILLSAALATVPWIRHFHWQFSLRTLLIATTLIAVVLGMAVYLLR